jgi:hypothetical protein
MMPVSRGSYGSRGPVCADEHSRGVMGMRACARCCIDPVSPALWHVLNPLSISRRDIRL